MSRLTNLIKEVLRTPIHELEERFKVIDTRTGEVIDNDLPKKLAQKLAAKKKEWYPYPDKKESTIAKIARTLDESKKKDCNCGCNTCENVGNEGVLLNESVAPKQILSENLQYHVHNKLPLTENTFRYGSQSFINLWAEARALYLREIIHVNDDDKEILTETDLGNYGVYEGKKVPLGLPMENTVNESEDLDWGIEKINWKRIIDREYKEAQRVFGQAVDTKPTEEDYAAAEEYVKTKHGNKWHVEALGINKAQNKLYIQAQENLQRHLHTSQEDTLDKEYVIDRPTKNLSEAAKKKKKKDPPIGKPKRGGSKAYYVYVRDPRTKKVKKVSFGSGGLKAKINNPKARKAFAARHKCAQKKDKTKAGYWSCRLPRYAKLLGLKSSFSGFW